MEYRASDTARLEAVACMWEAVLDMLSSGGGIKGKRAQVEKARERIGTSALRLTIIGFADELEADWQHVKDDYPEPFDWSFVPGWLAHNVVWSDHYPTLMPKRVIPGKDA